MPIIIILLIIVVIMSIKCVKVIQQSTVGIVMRLGKFHKKADTGVHFLVPFIDTLSYRIDLKERVEDFPPQPVITKDNVTMQIDTVVYYQVTDPIRFVFEIANPNAAIENLTATTLRNIIGELDLDATLTSRDVINTKMRAILDEATDKWGIKVNRVELKNILPPREIQDAMEKQMKAERQRREAILTAEGEKASKILVAEGQKESKILAAEADKQSAILAAEAIKEAKIREAEGEAEAIIKVEQARAKAIELINSAAPGDGYLTIKSLEACEAAADGNAPKLIIPSNLQGLAGLAAGVKEIVSE